MTNDETMKNAYMSICLEEIVKNATRAVKATEIYSKEEWLEFIARCWDNVK